MMNVKKSAQSLLVFMLFAGLSPVVSTASQPSASTTNQFKKYACSWPECIKIFTKKINLTRHMRTHTGEKAFQCQTCSKNFTRNEGLKTHMRTHTGEKPFQCPTCGKRFTQKRGLRQHLNKKNPCKPLDSNSPVQDHVERSLSLESYLYQPLQLDFKNKGTLPADDPMDFFPDVDFHNEDNLQLGASTLLLHFQPKSQPRNDLPLPVSTNNDF